MGIWAGIKHAVNSTLGTSNFKPLDQLINDKINSVSEKTFYLETLEATTYEWSKTITGRGRILFLNFVINGTSQINGTGFRFEIDGINLMSGKYFRNEASNGEPSRVYYPVYGMSSTDEGKNTLMTIGSRYIGESSCSERIFSADKNAYVPVSGGSLHPVTNVDFEKSFTFGFTSTLNSTVTIGYYLYQ